MAVRIIYHERCFDGLASAALFARFFRRDVDATCRVEYAGARYTGRRDVDTDLLLTGAENAIVDFKYSSDPRVGWWFDHHASAFASPDDARHFELTRGLTKVFDPSSPSCARLIHRTVASRAERVAEDDMEEVVAWADRIDTGTLRNAAEAVELTAPALRVGLVIQSLSDAAIATRVIEDLQRLSLAELERQPYIASLYPAARAAHFENVDEVRMRARIEGPVFVFDVASHRSERIDRYIPFYLAPSAVYSVGVMRSPGGLKVTIAFNPWSPTQRGHDIASLCVSIADRLGIAGAGGHAGIGGIPFRSNAYADAVNAANLAVAALRSADTPVDLLERRLPVGSE
jgi:hypothetical protein